MDSGQKHAGMTTDGAGVTGEGRWRSFTYEELVASDNTNLDIFWLKDDSLQDTENLTPPDVLAAEIVEQLEAVLEEFRSVVDALGEERQEEVA
jgi:type I restriction enzyme M protein